MSARDDKRISLKEILSLLRLFLRFNEMRNMWVFSILLIYERSEEREKEVNWLFMQFLSLLHNEIEDKRENLYIKKIKKDYMLYV